MNKRIFTVGQVTQYIRNLFARDGFLGGILVSGEVSNCKYHTSGHIYFSLKDQKSSISCIMFAGSRKGLLFPMKDGDKVVVSGNIDIYEKDGRYQLYASSIRREGTGDLYEKFLALKKELEEEGLFDRRYKKAIPKYAMRIGVVTAPTGAAVRDIQNIAARRNPYVQLILYPALVQGEGAPASIVRGIRMLDQAGVDVMIVGRGGGSYEDLAAFNEEAVARAVFSCSTPVISAVGHETDTTITDYVADLRAPTPSAAAELAVFDLKEFHECILRQRLRMENGIRNKKESVLSKCRWYEARLSALSPAAKLREKRHLEAEYQRRAEEGMLLKLQKAQERCGRIGDRMHSASEGVLLRNRMKQHMMIERMKGLNPLGRLRQGYSYVSDINGNTVNSIKKVKSGQNVLIYVTDGMISADVTGTKEAEYFGK